MSKISKAQLLANFCEILSDTQIEKISVTQLVKRCRVSRQAFYYHFSGVDELVGWGIERITGNALFDGRKNKTFGAAAAAYLNRISAQKKFLFKCIGSKYEAGFIESARSSAKELALLYFSTVGESTDSEKVLFFSDFISAALAMAAYDAVLGAGVPEKSADYLNELAESLRLTPFY